MQLLVQRSVDTLQTRLRAIAAALSEHGFHTEHAAFNMNQLDNTAVELRNLLAGVKANLSASPQQLHDCEQEANALLKLVLQLKASVSDTAKLPRSPAKHVPLTSIDLALRAVPADTAHNSGLWASAADMDVQQALHTLREQLRAADPLHLQQHRQQQHRQQPQQPLRQQYLSQPQPQPQEHSPQMQQHPTHQYQQHHTRGFAEAASHSRAAAPPVQPATPHASVQSIVQEAAAQVLQWTQDRRAAGMPPPQEREVAQFMQDAIAARKAAIGQSASAPATPSGHRGGGYSYGIPPQPTPGHNNPMSSPQRFRASLASQQGRRPVYGQRPNAALHRTAPAASSRRPGPRRPSEAVAPHARSSSGRRTRPGDARDPRGGVSPGRKPVTSRVDSGLRPRAKSAPRREHSHGAPRAGRSVPSHTVVRQRQGRTVYDAAPHDDRRSRSAGRAHQQAAAHGGDRSSSRRAKRGSRGSFGSSDRFGSMPGYGPGRGEGRAQAMSPPPTGPRGGVHREVVARHSDRSDRAPTPTLQGGEQQQTAANGGGWRQASDGSAQWHAAPGMPSRGVFSSGYGAGGLQAVPSIGSSPPSSGAMSPQAASPTPPSASSPPAPPLSAPLQIPTLPGQMLQLASMTVQQLLSAPNGAAVLAQVLAALQVQGGSISPAAMSGTPPPASAPPGISQAPHSKTLPLDEPPEDDKLGTPPSASAAMQPQRLPPQPQAQVGKPAHAYTGPDLFALAGHQSAPLPQRAYQQQWEFEGRHSHSHGPNGREERAPPVEAAPSAGPASAAGSPRAPQQSPPPPRHSPSPEPLHPSLAGLGPVAAAAAFVDKQRPPQQYQQQQQPPQQQQQRSQLPPSLVRTDTPELLQPALDAVSKSLGGLDLGAGGGVGGASPPDAAMHMYNGRSGRDEFSRYQASKGSAAGAPPPGQRPDGSPQGALQGAGGGSHFSGLLGRLTQGSGAEAAKPRGSGRRSPPQALSLPPAHGNGSSVGDDASALYSNRDGSPRRVLAANWDDDKLGRRSDDVRHEGRSGSPEMDSDTMQQLGDLNSALGRIDSLLSKYS